MLSPSSPYVVEKWSIKPGEGMKVKDVDQPAISNLLRRKNDLTNTFNYLFSIKKRSRYVTALYVEDATGAGLEPVALEGFMWQHDVDMNVSWVKGKPLLNLVGRNEIRLIERFTDNIVNCPGFSVMNVMSSAPDQNLSRKVRDGFEAARTLRLNGSCEHTHRREYDDDIRAAFAASRGKFDFTVD